MNHHLLVFSQGRLQLILTPYRKLARELHSWIALLIYQVVDMSKATLHNVASDSLRLFSEIFW